MAATELIGVNQDQSDDPTLATCYARGRVFKREGNFMRVEKGMRSRVSRALCVIGYYESRCQQCPNYNDEIVLVVGCLR
jgi:hypothetical protein